MIAERLKLESDYEVDHRIANNLAVVSGVLRRKVRALQDGSRPVSGQEAIGVLAEAAFQVEVVANLHKLLSNKAEERLIDLDQYLRSVCNSAVPALSVLGRIRPEYRLECGRRVVPEFAVSIGLAIAELISNAMKHAHPADGDGEIVVGGRGDNDQLVIEVADDGVGLPAGYDPMLDEGLGLQLVRATAARWGGIAEFDASEPGLCVRLVLPADAGQAIR